METIQFIYGNFRYLVFKYNDRYFLLDRSPRNLIGYFLPPINWSAYQNVYPLTHSQYQRLREQSDRAPKLGWLIPIALGLSVFIVNRARLHSVHIDRYFETGCSTVASGILLLIGIGISYILARGFYGNRQKSMEAVLGTQLSQPLKYKIRPVKIQWKQLVGFFFVMWGLTIALSCSYLYSGNLLYGLSSLCMFFICFIASNVVFGTETNQSYTILAKK